MKRGSSFQLAKTFFPVNANNRVGRDHQGELLLLFEVSLPVLAIVNAVFEGRVRMKMSETRQYKVVRMQLT